MSYPPHKLMGLTVVEVPKFNLPDTDADADTGYQDAACQGCVFNSPIYEVARSEGRTCKLVKETKCVSRRTIFVLPAQLEDYQTRFAVNRLEGT